MGKRSLQKATGLTQEERISQAITGKRKCLNTKDQTQIRSKPLSLSNRDLVPAFYEFLDALNNKPSMVHIYTPELEGKKP